MQFREAMSLPPLNLADNEFNMIAPKRLVIKVRATHSGMLVNRRVYPGRHVEASYKSFISDQRGGTASYDKPVLVHHDIYSDPIGRVIGASFSRLKEGDDFDSDYKHPDTLKTGKGSGIVDVDLEITDSTAIEKILSNRYSTVSVGSIPEHYYCSICGKDWAKKDCDHQAGETYEDEETGEKLLCYGITGPLEYMEISFVNVPAQPNAKVISINNCETPVITTNDQLIQEMVLTDAEGNEVLLVEQKNSDSTTKGNRRGVIRRKSGGLIQTGSKFADPFVLTQEQDEINKSGKASPSKEQPTEPQKPDPEVVVDPEKDEKAEGGADNTSEEKSTTGESQTMDKEKSKELSEDVLRASLEALTRENETLKATVASKTEDVAKSEGLLTEKTEEIKRLQQKLVDMGAEMAQVLATALLNTRILLKKPTTQGIKSSEDFQAALNQLAERTVDSLRDSLADLLPEVEEFRNLEPEPPKKDSLHKKEPTKDPRVGEFGEPPAKPKDQKVSRSSVLDKLVE